jgi:hypothetical protein
MASSVGENKNFLGAAARGFESRKIPKPVNHVDATPGTAMPPPIRGDAPLRTVPSLPTGMVPCAKLSSGVAAKLEQLTPEISGRIREFQNRK